MLQLCCLYQVIYLPVGHTHEDIDVLFGVLASKLLRCDAFTPERMMQLFRTLKEESLPATSGYLRSDDTRNVMVDCAPVWDEFFKVSRQC